jgi:hypothetical protein
MPFGALLVLGATFGGGLGGHGQFSRDGSVKQTSREYGMDLDA